MDAIPALMLLLVHNPHDRQLTMDDLTERKHHSRYRVWRNTIDTKMFNNKHNTRCQISSYQQWQRIMSRMQIYTHPPFSALIHMQLNIYVYITLLLLLFILYNEFLVSRSFILFSWKYSTSAFTNHNFSSCMNSHISYHVTTKYITIFIAQTSMEMTAIRNSSNQRDYFKMSIVMFNLKAHNKHKTMV